MKRLLPFLAIALLATSCFKESLNKIDKIHGAKWSGTYAIAALQSDLSLNDAVELVSGFGGVGSFDDNTIYLEYAEQENSLWGFELIKIPDQNFSSAYSLSGSEQTTLTSGSVQITKNFTSAFNVNGLLETDSIWFNKGSLLPTLNNNYDHPCTGTLSFPDMRKGGQLVSYAFAIAARGQWNPNLTLDSCKLLLSEGGTGYNQIRVSVDVKWTNSGAGFSGGDNLDINLGINQAQFGKIFGLFSNAELVRGNNSFEVSIFKNSLKSGSFSFESPRLQIRVSNGFGIPLNLATNSLSATYNSGPDIAFTGYANNKSIAAKPWLQNQKIEDSIVLNSGNSNVKTLVNQRPTNINYDFSVNSTSTPPVRHCISSDSRINVKVSLYLPFHGISADVALEDTLGIEIDNPTESQYIDWIMIRLGMENDIPLNVAFQGYFLDSQYNVLDSLFQPFRYFIQSANIDANGTVTSPYTERYDVTFEKPRIQNILNAKNLRIRAILPTASYNGTKVPVKISRDQHLKIAVGIQTKLSVNETF